VADVRYTRRALADIDAQLSWLVTRNAEAANRLIEDLERAELRLSEHPLSGRTLSKGALRVAITTRFRYRMIYRVHRGILVVRVLHPRQGG
jgi:plasmid stabilization system protein ParE